MGYKCHTPVVIISYDNMVVAFMVGDSGAKVCHVHRKAFNGDKPLQGVFSSLSPASNPWNAQPDQQFSAT